MNEITTKIFSMPHGNELNDFIKFSQILGETPFYKKLGAGGVLTILMTARELNIPVMTALNGGLWTFDGKVTVSAQLMNFMIISKGHRADIIELNDEKCIINFVRGDRKINSDFKYIYTMQDAKNSGLADKDNWKKNKRDMLFNRCLSGGARKFMPDVLMQSYTHEEMCDSDNKFKEEYIKKDLNLEQKNKETTVTEPLKKEITKENFEAFIKKHDLNSVNKKSEYISEIAIALKKTQDEIINFAIENEERFESGFTKWVENKKKPDFIDKIEKD